MTNLNLSLFAKKLNKKESKFLNFKNIVTNDDIIEQNKIKKVYNNYQINQNFLFDFFPIGLLILSTNNQENSSLFNNPYELVYHNEKIKEIFNDNLLTNFNEEKLKLIFTQFKKVNNLDNKLEENENLYKKLFSKDININSTQNGIYFSYHNIDKLIYVKIKAYLNYKLITIEDFEDERNIIKNRIHKNLNSQFLTTISHELKNPLNCLNNCINMIEQNNTKFREIIKINLRILKFFISTFIISLKIFTNEDSEKLKTEIIDFSRKRNFITSVNIKHNVNNFNLEFILNSMIKKYSKLFETRNIKVISDCLKLIKNLWINYEYIFFKQLLKNILIYFCYLRDRNFAKLELETSNAEDNKLKISFFYIAEEFEKNDLQDDLQDDFNIKSSVKTLEIIKEACLKLVEILKIKIEFNEVINFCEIILYINYSEEILNNLELSPGQEISPGQSNHKNFSIISRSVSDKFSKTFLELNKENDLKNSKFYLIDKKKKDLIISSENLITINDDNSFTSNDCYLPFTKNSVKSMEFLSKKTPKSNIFNISDILVVDDEILNLNVMKMLFKKYNLIPGYCMNGHECLQKVQENEYKLILMDVMMPIMDGIEASKRIQELIENNTIKNNINIVLISAHPKDYLLDITKHIKVIKEVVSKPINKNKFNKILEKFYF